MSKIPEGVSTKTAEGRDVQAAVDAIAEQFGVDANQIAHKIDVSHFRSPEGGVMPRDTVKVIGWVDAEGAAKRAKKASPSPRAEREPRSDRSDDRPPRARESRSRDRDRERPPRRESRGEDLGTTEASTFAKEWFEFVIDKLRVEGAVEASGSDDRVHVRIQPTAKAGRLIGRRGTTLAAIRHLLGLALEQHGSFDIDIDVDDDRSGGRDRDRGEDRGRGRSDRSDRSDRSERRGGRGRGRGGDDAPSGGVPEDKLRALARRAAEKAIETGKTITINLPLNSYDRRLVHVEVSEIDGVGTRSVDKDDKRVVQVFPE